jgi:hypothetical protein
VSIPALLAPTPLALALPLATTDWLQPGVTALAAIVAIIGVIITVVVQRRTSRETLEQARRSADSAALSAAAADRSSRAAEEAVGVNRETAAGVGKRAEADALAKRYQDAATQLGHVSAAVRLAGVYAMGRLADDWPEQRQSCVDVLCACLRMPISREAIQAAEGERSVRTAIVALVGEHLDAGRSVNWCDCDLDFSYAELPVITWSDPTFRKRPRFAHARLTDRVSMSSPRFEQGIDLAFCAFDGLVQIDRARISGGDVVLYGADLRSGVLRTEFLAEGRVINLGKAVCRGEFGVVCSPGTERQGRVALQETVVKPGGTLYLDGVDLEGAEASTTSHPGAIISVEPEGLVRLPPTFKEFSGKEIYNDVWKN